MESKRRFIATSNLRATLLRRERSARWLSRKVGVSSALMGFVVNNHRTIAEEKARLVAAVLDEPFDALFIATDVLILDAHQSATEPELVGAAS